jgi:DNA sulfur modification protein DndD
MLVLAPNEHGKTSFFEAVTLGLFGREGLPLIPRARTARGADVTDRLNTTYSQFLAAVLHRRAIESGRSSCSVTIEIEDDDGEPLELKRKWHFRPDGSHKLGDDELTIYEGLERRPVAPPYSVEDREAWYRDFIAQRFLPPSLAEFFLFDGEQVQRYANRDMSDQVRSGIEGLLGLPVLRSLKESLAKYAQARRSGAAAPSDQVVKSVEADIGALESQLAEARARRDDADALLPDLILETDQLTQQLGGRGEGTVANVADLMREEDLFRAEAGRSMDGLLKLLAEDVALGLAGSELRTETKLRLKAEAQRERWEAARNEGNANLDRFVADLNARVAALAFAVPSDQREAIIETAKAAWEALWHPAPEGAADGYLHTSLMGITRMQALDRLESIEKRSTSELVDYVTRFRHSVDTADSKKRERLELEQNAPEADRLTAQLRDVSAEMGRLRGQRDDADRAIAGFEGQLASKRQELGRYVERIGRGAPALRRAQRADQFSQLIEKLLQDAVPTEVKAVATEMTKAWKAMSHMSDRVDRIEITPDCQVRMLSHTGEDLHLIDKSAGASQVFTQALITAITNVSGQSFPFIVDTPLARLSKEQRLGVLRTFTDRAGQVILLSTDEEVVDDKLDAIRDRIAGAYELKINHDKGVAVTSIRTLDLGSL